MPTRMKCVSYVRNGFSFIMKGLPEIIASPQGVAISCASVHMRTPTGRSPRGVAPRDDMVMQADPSHVAAQLINLVGGGMPPPYRVSRNRLVCRLDFSMTTFFPSVFFSSA